MVPYVIIVPEKFSGSSSNWRSHWNSLFYFQSQFFFYEPTHQLLVSCQFPLIFGGLRFVKNLGTFDLFIYSHRKLWKYGKHHEKFEEENEKIAPASTPELGSYYEYRNSRNVFPSCAGPVLAGSLYLILSLFLTLCTL
jgi:hypothetical protein